MIFLIHYVVRTPVKDIHFDFTLGGAITGANLDSVRGSLASAAEKKLGRPVTSSDVVIANVIPLPDGEPVQQGGS